MNLDNGELMQERTLTVVNFGEEKGKSIKTRVTLPRDMITAIIASEKPVQEVGGEEQHKVNVLLVDGNQLELYISAVDLTMLERIVGLCFTPV